MKMGHHVSTNHHSETGLILSPFCRCLREVTMSSFFPLLTLASSQLNLDENRAGNLSSSLASG